VAIDAIGRIMDQVKAYTQAAQMEKFAPQHALVMDPVPSPLEAQRAETQRRDEMRAEAQDEEQRSSQRRAEENALMDQTGQRIDRYA
jgi:hypothetical protein